MASNRPISTYFRFEIDEPKEFLKKFIRVASSYMFTPDASLDCVEKLDIAIGYMNEDLRKVLALLLYRKRGHDGSGLKRIYDLLFHLSINPVAFYSADTIRIITREMQAWAPEYLTPIHYSIKKLLPIVEASALPEPKPIKVSSDLDAIALTVTALTSGIHRNGMSLRQVAAQWVAAKLAFHNSDKDLLSELLISILEDSFIWFPRILKHKRGAYGSEFIHSIAAKYLLALVDKIDKIQFRLICSIEELLHSIKRCDSVRDSNFAFV